MSLSDLFFGHKPSLYSVKTGYRRSESKDWEKDLSEDYLYTVSVRAVQPNESSYFESAKEYRPPRRAPLLSWVDVRLQMAYPT